MVGLRHITGALIIISGPSISQVNARRNHPGYKRNKSSKKNNKSKSTNYKAKKAAYIHAKAAYDACIAGTSDNDGSTGEEESTH
jgi:hypothetical protein